jgi:hypothetical protein
MVGLFTDERSQELWFGVERQWSLKRERNHGCEAV